MKRGLVEMVLILDRSGSMSGLESDTIGGFNSLIDKQKKIEGNCMVTTVLFDDRYELLHDRINLRGVQPLTDKEYYVRGTTALLDAVGKTLNKTINAVKHTAEEEKPEKVLFVITTDGYENASREYSFEKVKTLIETQRDKYGWEFIFLGANIDAAETAIKFGISGNRAANYHADSDGTSLNYRVLNDAVTSLRESKELKDDWKKEIDEDYLNRKK